MLSPPRPKITLPTIAIQNPDSPLTKPPIVNTPCPKVKSV